MPFDAQVQHIDDDDIDNVLFGDKNPGANTIIGGKKPKEDEQVEQTEETEDNQEEQKPVVNKPKAKGVKPVVTAEELDDDAFLDSTVGKEEGEEDTEGTEKTDKTVKKPVAAKPVVAAPKKAALPEESEPDYEALKNYFVEQGIWNDIDLEEGTEWNAETFKQAQELQVKSRYDDLVDRTGPAGKKIIEFESNGGNPTEMVDLFKEQRAVQNFNIATAEGQEEFLREFYTAQGNSEKSVERLIKSLVDQGPEVLKEESEEKKVLWDSQYQQEIEATATKQALVKKQMEEVEKNFQKNITATVTADPNLTPKERRELRDYILTYNQSYQGGQVSQFYTDMVNLQQDPANYLELAKFIKGLKSGDYAKKIADKTKKEVTAKTFLKIKGGSALKTGGGSSPEAGEDGSSFVRMLQTQQGKK